MKDHFDENNHVDLTEVDSVVSSIIHSFISRARLGKEKYGKTLDRTDLKVKDWINHAQEELMDGILYLEKLKQTSGTMLLNHDPSPSPPESPLPSPSPMFEVKYRQNTESVCGGKDCACDKSNKVEVEPLQNENNMNMNIEYQISVLTGEQCNIEKNVVKNSSLPESKLLFDNFKMNAKQQGITALILYAVDTLTHESKSIMNWFADEINSPIENKYDTMDAEQQEQYCGF
jgi:hypothetical protein